MNAQETIAVFLQGKMDIVTFRELYNAHPEINACLQEIVDKIGRTNTPTVYHWETRKDGVKVHSRSVVDDLLERNLAVYSEVNPRPAYRTVQQALAEPGDVRCTMNALSFYQRVYDIYLQQDPAMAYDAQYANDLGFMLDAVPQYLHNGPSEVYIREHVLPLYPETMKKAERKKAVKARIQELFVSERSHPQWVYYQSEWPLSKNGLPALFIAQHTDSQHTTTFLFRDRSDGTEIHLMQSRGW